MSYSILTIPFSLAEKSGGEHDLLNRGFVADEWIEKYFKSPIISNKGFLYVAEFNSEIIKRAFLKTYLEHNCPGKTIVPAYDYKATNPLKRTTVYDQKYLTSFKGNFNMDVESGQYSGAHLMEFLNIKNKERSSKIIFKTNLVDTELNSFENTFFEVLSVKVIFNRQNSNKGVGFGFISITLNWDLGLSATAKDIISQVRSISEFFRYFGPYNYNSFLPYFINNDGAPVNWKSWLNARTEEVKKEIADNFDQGIQYNGLASFAESNHLQGNSEDELRQDYIQKKIERKFPFTNDINDNEIQWDKDLEFKSVVGELLKCFLQDEIAVNSVFNFTSSTEGDLPVKPYVLYLDNRRPVLEKLNDEEIEKKLNEELNKEAFELLRIPDNKNAILNRTMNFEPERPDSYCIQYCLNEGALVLEGVSERKALINKYYPAFLAALNQKYLFQYLQERINEVLTVDQNGDYDLRKLRRLRGTLVKAEFFQVFTSLSNYHEITIFFDTLRSRFKINELKEEYMASIGGLSGIAELAEIKARESKAIEQEGVEKQRDKRMNLLLLFLTLAQVWVGIFTIPDIATDKLSNNFVYAYYIGFALLFILGAYQALKYYRQKINKSNLS